MSVGSKFDSFHVPLGIHLLSGFVERCPSWWSWLGDLESASLRPQLEQTSVDRPVYVTGLARAGTTILLEILSRHSEVGTHKYRDFPGVFVPTWWDRGQSGATSVAQERAHGDKLKVTPDSPEAMEECLWMAYFPNAHNVHVSNVLDERTSNRKFEKFYRDHIRKLLIARGRTRYVAKGNYNLTRLSYLAKFQPSARFVIAVRDPSSHIASLIRQHRVFCEGAKEHPRALAHLQRVGHFEFGLDRRPINVGDGVAEEVDQLWKAGEEVRGCARYWASLYNWLADELERNSTLQARSKIVQYEKLCDAPEHTITELLVHCELASDESVLQFAAEIGSRNYYDANFSAAEEAAIAEETQGAVERIAAFG